MNASLPHPRPQEAINLLEPMTNDPVNYVRQGALIASALIMIQQTEVTCPKVASLFNLIVSYSYTHLERIGFRLRQNIESKRC